MGAMPANCTGLSLLDECNDFCKINCTWSKSKVGRPKLDKSKYKKTHPRAKMKNPRSICLMLETDLLNYIKSQSMHKSLEEGKYISPNELIREALARSFPVPSQFDMFGKQV